MKSTLKLLCLTLWLSSASYGQSSPPPTSEPTDAVVVKHSWSKERINWEGDPFGGPVETFDDIRRRMADQRRVDRARAAGNAGEAAKVEREMRAEQVIKARPPAPPRYGFIYKFSIRNTGAKTIRLVDWDYVFFDSASQTVSGRLEFTSEEKVGPGKNKELIAMSRKPPAPTVSVYELIKNEREGLDGEVVLVRIEYTDGTVWQRP
ncbi:MAG TPA: hypothetical protein VMS31_08865 [Pyrinomonadaceae bacterium]|nr:hypothetical protein [Pyrinomonadaceae bacterium]